MTLLACEMDSREAPQFPTRPALIQASTRLTLTSRQQPLASEPGVAKCDNGWGPYRDDTMSNFISPRDSGNSVSTTTRSGSRHQIKRSITEFAAPVKLSRHRKDRYHDERGPKVPGANLQHQTRFSLDTPRSEGMTPKMSPDQSRRPSVMLQREEENRTALIQAELKANLEEKLRVEQDKASSRVE